MKKQTKIIIGVFVLIAVVVMILAWLFPNVYEGITSGSFGKAEKYRKDQMSEQDILLRSEFTKDTAQLHQMITGLIYFTLFTENLTKTIDSCLVSFSYQGFDKDPKNQESIRLLKDYNEFIRNNTGTIAQTTKVLSDIYLSDTNTFSADIEQNLRDFSVFVIQVNEKDSLLMMALEQMDHFLIGNKKLQQNREEIRKLKAIRDEIILQSTQFFALTNNKEALGNILSYAIQSQTKFEGTANLGFVDFVESHPEISSFVVESTLSSSLIKSSAEELNVTFSAAEALNVAQVGHQVQSKDEISAVVLYDQSSLSFLGLSSQVLQGAGSPGLNQVLQFNDFELGVCGVISASELSVVLQFDILCNVLQSEALRSLISAQELNSIIQATELSSIQLSGQQVNFTNLSSGLQQFISAQSPLSGFQYLMYYSTLSQQDKLNSISPY